MSDFDAFAMVDLFTAEVETQTALLIQGLLTLEKNPGDQNALRDMMRAAHSLKGAARLMGITQAEQVAHAMEDRFIEAQEGKLVISAGHADVLLEAVDLLRSTAKISDPVTLESWSQENAEQVQSLIDRISSIKTEGPAPQPTSEAPLEAPVASHRTLRLAADRLDALMGLAGEIRVSARWLGIHSAALMRVKVQQMQLAASLREWGDSLGLDTVQRTRLKELQQASARCVEGISQGMEELEAFDRRLFGLSNSL
ncbi:MAG: Hpt domain-containing protein, partial [Candidatus Eremiobacteraeota bacterium]|nr:Hpt domain-containing protein [Candidatus Eremiobacteraeota bacterium]